MYLQFGKRIFDLTIAILGLIIIAVPMALIAILLRITSGSPIVFTQERVGKGGQIFSVKKFRTMSVRSVEGSSITVAGDSRVTAIGRYLRRWKLDELPQLWNVLVG